MRPTEIRHLLAWAAGTGVLVWALVRVLAARAALPEIGWAAVVVLVASAVGVLATALVLRPRIRRDKGATPVSPFTAARAAMLGLAASRAGAIVAGGYLGYLLVAVGNWDSAFYRRAALVSGVAALAAVGLAAAGLVLERVCRIPPDADGDVPPAGAEPTQAG